MTNKDRLENSNPPFDLPTHEEFVKYVDDFLEKHGIKPTAFGRKFLNDSAAILRLKETDLRLSTIQKICAGIEQIKEDRELHKMLQNMME